MAVSSATAISAEPIEYGQMTEITVEAEKVAISVSDTERIVREYFKDIPVLIQVARCESTFRHTLSDGSVLQGKVDSADTGVMQINKRYHAGTAEKLGLDLNDIEDNMAYARYLYEQQGTQPWKASAPCWNKSLAYGG